MKFLKKKDSELAKGTISARLNEKVIRHQRKIADHLNEKTRHLSGKAALFLLIFFCLVFGTYCLYLITSAIH